MTHWSLDEKGEWIYDPNNLYPYALELYSNDPSLPQGIPWEGYTFSGMEAIFKDDLFNGNKKSMTFDLIEEKDEGFASDEDSLILQFSIFNEDAYKYYTTLDLQTFTKGPFGGEPVSVFSNVVNGLGVFTSANSQHIQILP